MCDCLAIISEEKGSTSQSSNVPTFSKNPDIRQSQCPA
ncbi:hypothetical protein G210_3423 [Candida maltosa Xu316]|uniref:Uncharacterized protein n=1 Tax=Candida maltosa (strain Xu316) TaxID=1245528 RepID=M3HGD9_CANMX|nr:hypothetical protein G210_3423 [Candida maltosa Xu316]